MSFVIFFCVQSQISVWALRRMRTLLLSLRMRLIRERAQGLKSGGFMSSIFLERKHEYYDFFSEPKAPEKECTAIYRRIYTENENKI